MVRDKASWRCPNLIFFRGDSNLMARPNIITIAPVAAVADDICLAQTRASAGALTLNGAKAGTTLDFSRQINIASSANIAARTFTVSGTDAHGNSITDTVTGISNNTVATTKYFLTVTSITVDASFSANNVTVGTSAAIATKVIPVDHYDTVAPQVTVDLVSGTATWSVQETYSDIQSSTASIVWITPTAHSGKSSSLTAPIDVHPRAVRLITSAISAPTLRLVISQSRSGC